MSSRLISQRAKLLLARWRARRAPRTKVPAPDTLLIEATPKPSFSRSLRNAIVSRFVGKPQELRESENVALFPGLIFKQHGQWTLTVQGWVHRSRPRDVSRAQRFRNRFGLPEAAGLTWYWLMLKGIRGRRVSLTLNGCVEDPKLEAVSGKKGLFTFTQTLTDTHSIESRTSPTGKATSFQLQCKGKQGKIFVSEVLAVPEEGVSVVSDIDDTIKLTEVARKRKMMANTLLREFEPVEGMPELFQQWERFGCSFHYVSTSPYQLQPQLGAFVSKCGFPTGTFHLNCVGWRDARFWVQSKSSNRKPEQIALLISSFPQRKFVLVGDSGQHDAQCYAALALAFPDQVKHILIRVVSEKHRKRVEQALVGVDRNKWTLFVKVSDSIRDLARLVA